MKTGLVLSSPCNQRAPSIIPLNILLAYLCSVPHPSFSYNENVLFPFFPSGSRGGRGGAPRCSYRVERSGLFFPAAMHHGPVLPCRTPTTPTLCPQLHPTQRDPGEQAGRLVRRRTLCCTVELIWICPIGKQCWL